MHDIRRTVIKRAGQRLNQVRAVNMQLFATPPCARSVAKGNRQDAATAPSKSQLLRTWAERVFFDARTDTQRLENPHAVRAYLESGADLVQHRRLFQHGYLMTEFHKCEGGCQPPNPPA